MNINGDLFTIEFNSHRHSLTMAHRDDDDVDDADEKNNSFKMLISD